MNKKCFCIILFFDYTIYYKFDLEVNYLIKQIVDILPVQREIMILKCFYLYIFLINKEFFQTPQINSY